MEYTHGTSERQQENVLTARTVGFRNEVGECFVHAHMSASGWERENGTTAHAHHPQSGSWGDAIPATLSSFSKAAERAATTCPTCPSKVTEGCCMSLCSHASWAGEEYKTGIYQYLHLQGVSTVLWPSGNAFRLANESPSSTMQVLFKLLVFHWTLGEWDHMQALWKENSSFL